MDFQYFIDLINREVKPALGCTEPVCVALCVAKCCETLRSAGAEPSAINVLVSSNILKNGMGVGIPGTGMVGLPIASALGCVCGKSELGLEVLRGITPEAVEKARTLIAKGVVKIGLAEVPDKLYVCVDASGEGHNASCIIAGSHDAIVHISLDGKVLLELRKASQGEAQPQETEENPARSITVRDIYDFATTVPIEKLEFLMEGVRMNKALVEEGMRGDYGLRVGKTLLADDNKCVYGNTYLIGAMAATAAACDARMAGCTLPAMSNSGSGNQGLTVSVPVISIAEQTGAGHEQLLRALAISHLVAIHIKGYLGRLSALCGCVVASTGSACGITYLRGGSYNQICDAIKNMSGNITGMVCDGAKVGCALKVASGVASALQAAVLAIDHVAATSMDGIIEEDIEKTIENVGNIGSLGMQQTDNMILKIMVGK